MVGKDLQDHQVQPSNCSLQSSGAKSEETNPDTESTDGHQQQRGFYPARSTSQRQQTGSSATTQPAASQAVAIQLLVILYPYSRFVEHQTNKRETKSS